MTENEITHDTHDDKRVTRIDDNKFIILFCFIKNSANTRAIESDFRLRG